MMEAENDMLELPSNWVWTNLGDISEEVVKISPKDDPEKGFLYIDIASIDNRNQRIISHKKYLGKDAPSRARQLIKTGDILFSTVRTYLKNIAMVGEIYNGQIASTGFCVIRPNRLISSKLIFYYSQTDSFLNSLNPKQRGTSYPAVRNFDVFSQPFPLAPLPEQHRIVSRIEELFSYLDTGIAALQKAKFQLKRYRQAVLKAAVEGRLTEEWRKAHPEVEPAKRLLERILKEKRIGMGKSYKDPCSPNIDNLPQLPIGWIWASLEQLSEQIVDCLHSTPEFTSDGKYCIDTTCIEPGRILFDKARFVSEETYKERIQRLKPEVGDILFSREGTIGTAISVTDNVEFCLGQRMMMFRPARGIISSYFMWAMLSDAFEKQWKPNVTGTTAPHVNIRDLRVMALPLTSNHEQTKIIEEIESRFSVTNEIMNILDKNLIYAAWLRQLILSHAFEGRLVPQDPNDEPASVLLDRIKYEKAVHAPKRGRRINSNTTHQMRLIQ